MSKWDEIKSRLEHLGGQVTLLADGHKITLRKVHDGKRIFVVVYVDDYQRGDWTKVKDGQPVHPEPRFWRPMKRAQYKRKAYNQLKRIFGKKEADRMVTPQVIGFVPDFGTEGSAVAHLKKHFPDLEIKPDEEAPWSYADAIAKRQYGVERTAWLRTVDQYRGVIAALDVELEKRSRLAALEKQLAEHGLTLDDVETQFPNIRKGWRRHRQTLERLADHYAEGRA